MTLTGKISDSSFLPERIPEIDGLRGIAIIGVLACHLLGQGIDYEQSHWLAAALAKIALFGGLGVALFFIISGFLIGGILLDNKTSTNYFQIFYIRRMFRIFPIYYGLIFLFYGFSFLSAHQIFVLPDWLIGFTFSGKWYLTFTQNFAMARDKTFGVSALAPTWSLAVEEQFYLILPFIIRFISRKYLLFTIFILILAAPLFRALVRFQISSQIAPGWLTPCCFDFLMMGVMIAILFRSKKCYELILRYRQRLIFPVFLFLLFLWVVICLIILASSPIFAANNEPFGLTIISLIFGFLLISAIFAKTESLLSKILCNRILKKVGELSYFIYLFHMLIYLFIHWQMGIENNPPFGIVWFAEISLTLTIIMVLAQLSFKYFEKPLIDYGHKFKYLN